VNHNYTAQWLNKHYILNHCNVEMWLTGLTLLFICMSQRNVTRWDNSTLSLTGNVNINSTLTFEQVPIHLCVALLNTEQASLSHETCRGKGHRLAAKCTLRNKNICAVTVTDTTVLQLLVVLCCILIAPPMLRIHSSIIRSWYNRPIRGRITDELCLIPPKEQ